MTENCDPVFFHRESGNAIVCGKSGHFYGNGFIGYHPIKSSCVSMTQTLHGLKVSNCSTLNNCGAVSATEMTPRSVLGGIISDTNVVGP